MVRRRRRDFAGAWHHVTNRGVSSRPIFESREEIRYFLSRVARAVRRREIELVGFCILGTHFHLFVRSVDGRLADAMRQIQGQYAQAFNRRRLRDGGLYRGRYFSAVVDSVVYRDNLIRYIDANAVKAGLVAMAAWYPACSAHWYARRRGPPWLARRWVEGWVTERLAERVYRPESYVAAYKPRLPPSLVQWIEDRLNAGEAAPGSLDELIAATPAKVRAWLESNARLADGPPRKAALTPLVPSTVVEAALRSKREWALAQHPVAPLASREGIARAGLLRAFAGLGCGEIASRSRCAPRTASQRSWLHAEMLAKDPAYASDIADVVHRMFRYMR